MEHLDSDDIIIGSKLIIDMGFINYLHDTALSKDEPSGINKTRRIILKKNEFMHSNRFKYYTHFFFVRPQRLLRMLAFGDIHCYAAE